MKLTGWYRIGIVLSVLWCFVIIGLTIYQYNFSPKERGILITLEVDTTKPITGIEAPIAPRAPCFGDQCKDEGDYILEEYHKPEVHYDTKKVVNYKGVLISIIVPIVVVLFLILSIKWIIKGFKSQS